MDYYEVVTKLIGKVDPVGETNTDAQRLENLKELTNLVDKLLIDIDRVEYDNKDRVEYSMNQASKFAGAFLDKIGIQKD